MSLDRFIQDGQDPKVVEKIYSKIEDMLGNGETIKYVAIQKKPAVTLLPDCILISNRRIFLCEFTKLGLSTNFEIFSWKDIKDISFKEEIFGSKVTVIPFTGENLSIDYIPKTQARKLFQLIKEALEVSKQEELSPKAALATEKEAPKPIIPIREIYEKPKEEDIEVEDKQSFIEPITPIVSTPPVIVETQREEYRFEDKPITPIVLDEPEDEITQKLKKLKGLYDKQLISQSEYESKKAEILENL